MDKPDLSLIPTTPGVYLYKDGSGRILYVGKAKHLRKRVSSYFRDESQLTRKTVVMLSQAVSIDTLSTTTEKEALLLEASLIKKHRPRFNIALRDDKQYVLFRLQKKHPWPRLEITRKVRRDGAQYYGPFVSGLAARETWKALHRAFPLRRCTDRALNNRIRPCLYYHLKQCLAPCVLEVQPAEYAALIRDVEMLLAGRSAELLTSLGKEMDSAAEELNFERAAVLRDQIRAVERTIERQAAILPRGGDLDVLGLSEDSKGLALGILFVRGGTLIDGSTFVWPGLTLEDASELLLTFPAQFYSPLSAIPPRLVLPWLPATGKGATDGSSEEPPTIQTAVPPLPPANDDTHDAPTSQESEFGISIEDIAELLSDMRGSPVRLTEPKNNEERRLVDMAQSNAREALRRHDQQPLAEQLARALHRAKPVNRIECVDISHTGGTATRAGMVVFEDGKPKNSAYRSYAFADGHGDDYGVMAQWAVRRAESGPPWPDLLLIDGGRGQVAVVHKALTEAGIADHFALAGIAKARTEEGHADRRAGNVADRIFVPGRSNPLPIKAGSSELLYLQRIRDAAHSFVIGRHRRARAAEALAGELQRIQGIGPHLAQTLWQHFDSLDAMRTASVEELARVPGIGRARAHVLHERLLALSAPAPTRKAGRKKSDGQ